MSQTKEQIKANISRNITTNGVGEITGEVMRRVLNNMTDNLATQQDIDNIEDDVNAKYTKPSTGIPASDIADGVIPDVSQFVTKSVSDLANYYLKSETYTKDEVAALIGSIQQFHYKVYTSLPATGEGNVLYLIGPIGSGADKYEEYVYDNSEFVKIGDTSIDLSDYVKNIDIPIEKGSGTNSVLQKGAMAAATQATAWGNQTRAYGVYSHAEGDHSQASGIASHAEGSSQAHKDYSHSEGSSTDCHGNAGHTEGGATSVAGNYAHAEGDGGGSNTIAIVSINENVFTLSSVDGLTTDSVLKYDEFYYRIISINTSENTVTVDKTIVVSTWDDGPKKKYGVAYGIASHVEGRHGIAFGTNAHVEGNENVADGNASHAEGYNTQTRNNNEHAEGSFNVSHKSNTPSEKTVHSVGIGTELNDRTNAHEIMANGDHYIYGIGGYVGKNVFDVKSLQEIIRELQNNIEGIKPLEIDDAWINVHLTADRINLLKNACFINHANTIYPTIQADSPCLSNVINTLYSDFVNQGNSNLLILKAWGEYGINFDLSPITLNAGKLYFLIQYEDDNHRLITKLVLYELISV